LKTVGGKITSQIAEAMKDAAKYAAVATAVSLIARRDVMRRLVMRLRQ
jgi:hypothetical protein